MPFEINLTVHFWILLNWCKISGGGPNSKWHKTLHATTMMIIISLYISLEKLYSVEMIKTNYVKRAISLCAVHFE